MNVRRRRVLVVEDEASVRNVLRRLLGGRKLDLDEAGSLREAEACMAGAAHDLLISDIRLPDGNGWELIRAFRRREPGASIIVITGSPQEEAVGENVDGVHVVAKPFDIRLFRDLVDQVLAAAPLRYDEGGEARP